MSKLTFFIIIFVVLVIGGFYIIKNQTVAPEEPVEQSESFTKATDHFIQVMEETTIREVGQPIEGFEPFMFMTAFPGLVEEDFDNVTAQLGVYEYKSGALEFMMENVQPVHSAARAITKSGMGTLLENIGRRLGLSFSSSEEVDIILAKTSSKE